MSTGSNRAKEKLLRSKKNLIRHTGTYDGAKA